jgi:rod shape-determining protein MreC
MNVTSTRDQTLVIALALSILILGLDHQQILNAPKNLTLRLTSPIQKPFYLAKSKATQLWSDAKTLPYQSRRIKELERRLSEATLLAQKSGELEKELSLIKQSSKIISNDNYTKITAQVVSLTRFAIIDKGDKDGIKIGHAVIINDSLVGIIKSTLPNSSQIQLLKDPEISLEIVTLSGAVGKLKYQDNTLQAHEILQKNTLSNEEPVFTKGSQEIPAGLLIGYITDIKTNPSSVYKQAQIKEAFSITDQNFVLVATN